MSSTCSYCAVEVTDDDFLRCLKCLTSVHVSCLKSSPDKGMLLGDIFYDFICKLCGPAGTEEFKRRKLQW